MFERILLPLDGSQIAELAVPYAELLARGLGSEVVLLHTCRSEQEPYRHMYQIYLAQVANRLLSNIRKGRSGSVESRVQVETLVGEPADVICDYVQKNRISMVIMSAFGGSGIKTWMLGSVADKVVRAVNAPTLLIRTKNERPLNGGKRRINRILLPLDGSEVSKQSVPYAVELATELKASITLFGMAEKAAYYSTHISFVPYSTYMGAEYDRMDAAAERNVRAYLTGVEKELRKDGAHVTHAVTLGITPADDILKQADKANADLVVMATRGRSPINRWAFGSVAEKVLRTGELPLLLVKEAPE